MALSEAFVAAFGTYPRLLEIDLFSQHVFDAKRVNPFGAFGKQLPI